MQKITTVLNAVMHCAGRMYVFEHYVCFHSNVFGYVKNKTIPLKVSRAAHRFADSAAPVEHVNYMLTKSYYQVETWKFAQVACEVIITPGGNLEVAQFACAEAENWR